VVLHVLVSRGSGHLTAAQVALACERDPGLPADREAIGRALRELVEDGLTYRRGALFGATRAALRAFELGF
jgi:Arc/MetJ family transcription regulator